MNTSIYPVEFTATVKNYSDFTNHENVAVLKSLGYRVEHQIVSMKGGAFYRVSVSIALSRPADREIAQRLTREIFGDCDALTPHMCTHRYEIIGSGLYMKADKRVYEIRRCSHCSNSIKFTVESAW